MARLVYVVDDQPANRELLEIYLEAIYKVKKFDSGGSCLKAMETETPSVILLDINLDDVNGVDLCREMYASKDMDNTHVIFVTALDKPEVIEAALAAGGEDYITKPVDMQELLNKVALSLTRH